ncbi:NAC domain-containing protein 18-like protein [Cinnamomum micranthum f. kanehirae]|uniref:NAC domain-containing protein 18-like protein n=1 Tax=Cinnamomum micranthum f. kanehirae TaxID=337451 RepID=A0A443NLJ6_9MAGN|nr:NAC domain-containing protein 18-like protein [Cinnamomum micranthum f. kanehirae]
MMEDPYIPLGYRFCPTDEELIHYLLLKNYGLELPSNQIKECNVYAFNPDQLPQDFNYALGNELYFFTTRERKYFNGSRPSRTAGDGFWKATSVEQVIKGLDDTSIIGYKKKLVFYYKENNHNQKTDWQMHEYRIEKTDGSAGRESMKMDGFVICRIYKRKTKASKSDALAVELFNSFDF